MDRQLVRLTSSYAAVAALQQSSLYLGKLIIQSAVNGISLVSTAPISAFTAATRVENFIQAFGISGCESIAISVAPLSCGLPKESVILLEPVRTLDKRRLREKMGRLDEGVMKQVDTAIAVSFGLHPETMV